MKYLNWNSEKNEVLKRERGKTFEEIAYLIESGQIIGIEENPGRSNQKMYILEIGLCHHIIDTVLGKPTVQ